ncbi:hypothetical protein [Photorhabdus sp. MH8.4]
MECVVIENNALSLPKGMAEYGRAQSSLAMQMLREGATPDKLSEALAKQARGTHPEGQDPARGLIVAWGNFLCAGQSCTDLAGERPAVEG